MKEAKESPLVRLKATAKEFNFSKLRANQDNKLANSGETMFLYQLSLLMNQIRSIAELFNRGRGKRGNKITQSALKQNNCIVDFIAQNVLFYI